MIRKVCPCSGCGQTMMCVSHDTFKFYCNRCLPYYIRQQKYWMDNTKEEIVPEQDTKAKTVEPKNKVSKKPKNKLSKKSRIKKKYHNSDEHM